MQFCRTTGHGQAVPERQSQTRKFRRPYVQLLALPTVLAAVSIAGCGNPNATESDTLETGGLWMGVRFEATGNGATGVNVEINEGGRSGNDVRLSANERLEVNANGTIIVLEEDDDFLDIDYEGSVPTDASETPLTLSLYRADGSVNDRTRVNLPRRFEISTPVDDQATTVGEIVAVQWSPTGGPPIRMGITTQCSGISRSDFFDVVDDGNHSFNTAALPGLQSPDINRENGCTLTIEMRRERRGTLDPAFRAGGFVIAEQERIVRLPLSFPG